MTTRKEDIDARALPRRGWTISAIARHLGSDRKTIRAYLRGDRKAGVRVRPQPDPFGPFAAYCPARLTEDPHLWATTLFDEVTDPGMTARILRSPGSCERGTCGRTARRVTPRWGGRWR
jgi:transposase